MAIEIERFPITADRTTVTVHWGNIDVPIAILSCDVSGLAGLMRSLDVACTEAKAHQALGRKVKRPRRKVKQ